MARVPADIQGPNPLSFLPAFHPEPPLLEGSAHPACQASIIVPARNEETSLTATLDALGSQLDLTGQLLATESFEVLLLLNNCTDNSSSVAQQWQATHPTIALHIIERTLAPEVAHVGTARRLLMDTAWHRLHHAAHPVTAILSTDSDTLVAPDWIARNLAALAHGADAVGGVIHLKPGELESLPAGARQAYQRDRRYQRLVAKLEDLLDPQPGDPWPRHLEHFGASLACTPQIYARVGGMPPVKPLEDVAFVDALRRGDAHLRHDPSVIVSTSARFDGRAEIGLSHQLRLWQQMSDEATEHRVPSAAWLAHRFRTLSTLRRIFQHGSTLSLTKLPGHWSHAILHARDQSSSIAHFLSELDCDRLIDETFRGKRDGAISQVDRNLARTIAQIQFGFSPAVAQYETSTGSSPLL
jgi:hypothetical protein